MRCFVEALKKHPRIKYEGTDVFPGTDKVRTYVSNDSLYSKESDLENIIAREKGDFSYKHKRTEEEIQEFIQSGFK